MICSLTTIFSDQGGAPFARLIASSRAWRLPARKSPLTVACAVVMARSLHVPAFGNSVRVSLSYCTPKVHATTTLSTGASRSGPPAQDLRKLCEIRPIVPARLATTVNGFGELDGQATVLAHRFRPMFDLRVATVIACRKRSAPSSGLEEHHADPPDVGRAGQQIPARLFGG